MSLSKSRPGSRSLQVAATNTGHSDAARLARFSSPCVGGVDARASSTSQFGAFVSPTVDLKKKLSFAGAVGTPGRGILEAGSQPLRAFCRVRPLKPEERSAGPAVILAERPCTVRMLTREEALAEAPGTEGAASASVAPPATEAGSTFTFDGVFDPSTSQAELYTASFRPVVESAVHRGSHGLLFAYGMTSAGKTHTISGTDEAPGLLPRALHSVFSEVRAARERQARRAAAQATAPPADADLSRPRTGDCPADATRPAAGAAAEELPSDSAVAEAAADEADASDSLGARASDATLARLTAAVSYLEVYNEGVFDLLSDMSEPEPEAAPAAQPASRPPRHPRKPAEAKRLPLPLKEGRDGRVFVRGLRTVTVPSLARALEIMQQGAANKRVAETRLNADSSRSHTVFTISLFRHDAAARALGGGGGSAAQEPSSGGLRLWSRLSIVDLAGCERAGRSGATGLRLKEAGNINRSLSALMNCLDALRHNHKAATAAAAKGVPPQLRMVPYRESKLTRLFSDALSGASRGAVVMVVNAGPAAADREETLRALKYGAVAREVRIVPRVESQAAAAAQAGGSAAAAAQGGAAVEYGLDGRRVRRGEHAEAEPGAAETGEGAGEEPVAAGDENAKAGVAVEAGAEAAAGAGASAGAAGDAEAAALRQELAAVRRRFRAEKEAWLEARAALEGDKAELQEQWEEAVEALEAAQEEAARVEAEVREEVVGEMEARMAAMQAEFARRAEANEAKADARAQRLLGIAAQRTTAKKARATASRLQELGAGAEGGVTDTGSDLEDEDEDEQAAAAAEGFGPKEEEEEEEEVMSPLRLLPRLTGAEAEAKLAEAMQSAARHEAARRQSARLSLASGSSREAARSLAAAMKTAAEEEDEEEADNEESEDEDEGDNGGGEEHGDSGGNGGGTGSPASPVPAVLRARPGLRLSSLSDGGAEADGFAMAEAMARAEAAEAEAAELRAAVRECEAEAARVRERHAESVAGLSDQLEEARMQAAEAEAEALAGARGGGGVPGTAAGGGGEEGRLRACVARLEGELEAARLRAAAAEGEAEALRQRVRSLEAHVQRAAAMPLSGLMQTMSAQSMVGLATMAAQRGDAGKQAGKETARVAAPAAAVAPDGEGDSDGAADGESDADGAADGESDADGAADGGAETRAAGRVCLAEAATPADDAVAEMADDDAVAAQSDDEDFEGPDSAGEEDNAGEEGDTDSDSAAGDESQAEDSGADAAAEDEGGLDTPPAVRPTHAGPGRSKGTRRLPRAARESEEDADGGPTGPRSRRRVRSSAAPPARQAADEDEEAESDEEDEAEDDDDFVSPVKPPRRRAAGARQIRRTADVPPAHAEAAAVRRPRTRSRK